MKTLQIRMSDAEITRQMSNHEIKELYDPRHKLRLRFKKNRLGGSWYYVTREDGKTKWHKLGPYPAINFRTMIKHLPEILSNRIAEPDKNGTSSHGLKTIGEVLDWHLSQVLSDGRLSDSRKVNAKSAIINHLIPRLGEVPITHINRSKINDLFIWPMQQQYKASTVKMMFGLLKLAFKRAKKLEVVNRNPIEPYVFSDFIKSPIKPKPSSLKPADIPQIVEQLKNKPMKDRMLVVMMLAHGSRIGETRLAKWDNIKLKEKVWYLPEQDTKTKQEHKLPLTENMITMLINYRDLQKREGYRGAFLFPQCYRTGKAISAMAANTIFKQVSDRHWTSHDLRKVARTCWAELGIDYMIAERLLNHAMSRLDETYIHTYADNKKREALNNYHEYLSQQGLNFYL